MITFVYEELQRFWGWVVRSLKHLAHRTGLLAWLERHRANRALFYLRCLFAFYDIEDMVRLDVPFWTFARREGSTPFSRNATARPWSSNTAPVRARFGSPSAPVM